MPSVRLRTVDPLRKWRKTSVEASVVPPRQAGAGPELRGEEGWRDEDLQRRRATMTSQVGAVTEVAVVSQPASRILIVDDEPKIRSFIGRALTAAGYDTDFAGSGADGLLQAEDGRFDLVILDLVMPDMDGREVLGELLSVRPDQAVMVLSCVADVATKVDCLERGALDYLTKPFSLAELLARVRVRLRHELRDAHDHGRGHGEVLRVGGVTLDTVRLVADVGHGPVPLTRLEFLLLRELAEYEGHSVPKGQLLAKVWGYNFDPGSNVVDVCVRRLRSKLGFDLIKTVRGEGYQLAGR
jgi:two-component system, OmpR family, response regulator